jgi:hypothetical protein
MSHPFDNDRQLCIVIIDKKDIFQGVPTVNAEEFGRSSAERGLENIFADANIEKI